MDDDLGKEKKPLVWPTLNFEVEEDKHIEHIHLKLDESSIEQLLLEIELDYPHVAKKLELLLGYPEFEIEMQRLIVNQREGRQGFAKSILGHLLKLSNLHYEKYGMLNDHKIDIWNLNRL